MSTATGTLVGGAISNAIFQAFFTAFSAALDAGMPKTADTGQINTATASFPGVVNTSAGYEIRKFNDTLQATKPIVMKWEYGEGVSSSMYGIWLTIGTGSDGAGNITGINYTRRLIAGATAFSGTTNTTNKPYYIACGANYLVFCLGAQATTIGTGEQTTLFSIERSHDSAGNDTGEGYMQYLLYTSTSNNANAAKFGFYVPFTTTVSTADPNGGNSADGNMFPPLQQTSGLRADNTVAVYPNFFYDVGRTMPPSNCLVGMFNSDYIQFSTLSLKVYGVSHTFMGLTKQPLLTRGLQPSAFGVLMRYE